MFSAVQQEAPNAERPLLKNDPACLWARWSHKAAHSIMAPIVEIDQPAPFWVISLWIPCNAISRRLYFAFALLFDPPLHIWVGAALCCYEFFFNSSCMCAPLPTPLRVPLKRITDCWQKAKMMYPLRQKRAFDHQHCGLRSEKVSVSLGDWHPQRWASGWRPSDLPGSRCRLQKQKLLSRSDLLK